MQISLTPQAEKILQERIASGRYETVEAAIEDALFRLDAVEKAPASPEWLDYAKREVAVGIEAANRGDFSTLTLAEMNAEVLRRNGIEPQS